MANDYISVGINLQLESSKNAQDEKKHRYVKQNEKQRALERGGKQQRRSTPIMYAEYIENAQEQFNGNEIKLMLELYSIDVVSCKFPLV